MEIGMNGHIFHHAVNLVEGEFKQEADNAITHHHQMGDCHVLEIIPQQNSVIRGAA